MSQIVELKADDCWGESKDVNGRKKAIRKLFCDCRKTEIAWMANATHPYVMGYVFAVQRMDGWDKMSERGLQKKLSNICKEIGIKYKIIYRNEVIGLR